ncbi:MULTISPECIES: 2TM domain-containing protein [unclassified Roseateles]|uniref:2TM domain-containing protein n=1 Tax=unclassified Roseateles TaxID=2626991 RepID=UPI0010F7A950|nr:MULTISPECIES: 2TM domain-containing protein [unclassified Roseateles]MCZ7881813.1 2TM domain-containing protein [Paucibacter sp. M5-1]MDC6170822.1 2TM domain-containing protein [Paucibacter sp. XJ19-41]
MTISTPTEQELRDQAKKRVDMKMGFLVHLTVFVAVNLGLIVLNSLTGGPRWHVFPLWGWGLGLAVHGLVTLLALMSGGGLRERMMAAELERLRRQ